MFFKKRIDYNKLFEKYVDSDFSLFACGENAPSHEILKKFEKEKGIKLPTDFKEFSVSSLGGICVEVKEQVWPRARPLDVGEFWSFLYGFTVYGFPLENLDSIKNIPDWMNIEIQSSEYEKHIGASYIPFMKIMSDPDLYCFDKKGLIYCWDHELNEFNKIDKSFNELLEFELSELKQRKDKKKSNLNE